MIKANLFVMKMTTLGILFSILMTTSVKAENINGIEFTLPETWTLSNSETSDSLVQNFYIYNDEVIAITVQDISSLTDELKLSSNLMLMDCSSIYGEKEGYYLMTDESYKSDDGYETKFQECVYYEDQWAYIYLATSNTGNEIITLLYCSPTLSDHTQLSEVEALVGFHILGVE